MELDAKDKKIIGYMTDNARASISEIARKTGLPRDSVRYRIQRLEKTGIIFNYHTFIDHKKIGYPVYMYIMIELHNFNHEDEEKLYAYLKEHKHVPHIAKVTGRWDIMIALCAKDLAQFDTIFREIRRSFGHIIKDYQTASIIEEHGYDDFTKLL